MFKKATLALAISGLLGASAAQAAVVYDQDGTTLDIYGRIAMGFEGGGEKNGVDNGEEFRNFGSRLRFTAGHQINADLRAFARVEWRFTGDERSRPGFDEVRNSYLGLESKQYGTFMAGNYNSYYDNYVMTPFDVYVERGYEFAGGGLQARGDSLGYKTPEINGFQAVFSAKHFSERGLTEAQQSSEGSVIATQGGVVYATGPLRLALGYVEDTVRGGGNGETRFGTTATYDINDAFSARLGYETRGDNDKRGGGFDTVGLGGSFATGAWTFYLDYYNIDPDNADNDRDAWAAAAHYDVSNNLDVFVELNDANKDANDNFEDDLYYAIGARYHF
ncbi:porin [Halomonas sp. XH26]|uniref:porin n=1 Tax=Halomonadaceae TaxID=28256 RepID=UPI000499CD35|nr:MULTISPECIES: porin [Halomonas]AIA74696.1 porin [Halomonas campaniensis]AYF33160.1 porin [Halomonas alkaliphila]MCD6005723.1 porin [Halomonas sp. IOP_6]MCD6438412.1 porin [Halomonas sp.]UTA80175.1 porin [Halomonas sp. XH26]